MIGEVLGFLLLAGHVDGFQVALVATQNNRDILANAPHIMTPAVSVLECQLGRVIKEHNSGLALDVVAVAQSAELLLAGDIPLRRSGALRGPDVEDDGPVVGVELDGMYFYTHSRVVALVKLTSAVSLDQSGFASGAVADQNHLDCFDSRGHSESVSRIGK